MNPHWSDDDVTLYAGDCLEVLRELPDASVDAVVTDPPYSLSFMGRTWDEHESPLHFQQWCEQWARECLRILKPGGHLLAFGGTRTGHRLASGIEDAWFEVRDSIAWLYGSGFPKSLDVGKAIDRAAGAERADVYEDKAGVTTNTAYGAGLGVGLVERRPATDDARTWQGWGTALKPAHEPIVVARRPLAGTVASNVLAYGTGGINVDACRVATDEPIAAHNGTQNPRVAMGDGWHDGYQPGDAGKITQTAGRWPPNVLLGPDAAAELDRQSGTLTSHDTTPGGNHAATHAGTGYHEGWAYTKRPPGRGDSGGASRFFPVFKYEAKAPTSERPRVAQDGAGEGRVTSQRKIRECRTCGSKTLIGADTSPSCGHEDFEWVPIAPRTGHVAHPTVKPLALMRWLVRLVTPPGGTVLDPFAGSGTTGEAAIHEHMRAILIEREPDYLPLIVARLTKPHAVGFDLEGIA